VNKQPVEVPQQPQIEEPAAQQQPPSDSNDESTHVIAPPSDKEVFTRETRSLSSIAFHKGASVATIEKVMVQYPLPPKKGAKKEEKKKGELAVVEPKIIPPETVDQTYQKTVSWNCASNIHQKVAVGTLTTAKYQERVQVFTATNEKVTAKSAMWPPQTYFGETPNPAKDPYDRRKVKQLNDISFEESEDSTGEADFESIKSIKRLP